MCGIAGIFSVNTVGSDEIRVMTESIHHRGPDAFGYFEKPGIALGHRRLSILDLDARSNQPLSSSEGRYTIVYNGEIYNFKEVASELRSKGVSLRTTSDTEVVVEAFALWGPGFVQKLHGMFAFAIYDNQIGQLYLYRDRVGKKPLFYYHKDGVFLFASEIKALMQHPLVRANAAVNHSSISTFLQLGYIPQPNTFFKEIYKFPAGCYGVIPHGGTLVLLPYWNLLHYIETTRFAHEQQALLTLKELVTDAVQKRLIADVPVGLFLSGGIDSSLVASVAARQTKIKSFSIGFTDKMFDESVYAARVAKHIGTDHHAFTLTEQHAVELVDDYLNHFDEPFADTSAIPTMLVSKLARKEVTVALTGDGGDELFLGYGAYTWAQRLGSKHWLLARPVLKYLFQSMPNSRMKRIAHLFEEAVVRNPRRHIFSQEQYFFSEQELKNGLLRDPSVYHSWSYDDLPYLKVLSNAERQALFDFQYYLRDDLLVKVDRASMKYGLECRSPLLDHRLAEFAFNLPTHLRKRGGVTKYLLKKMLFEMVPAQYFDRPKKGFSMPLVRWLKTDLKHLMSYLDDGALEQTGVFSPHYVSNLKRRFFQREDYLYNRLWALIIVQKFLKKS